MNVFSRISWPGHFEGAGGISEEKGKLACKPGSVEHLAAFRQSFIWAGSCLPARATYPGAARAVLSPPYLVLLRMGFALPPLLPEARWALTLRPDGRPHRECAPFHPRLIRPLLVTRSVRGFAAANVGHRQTILCGTFHRLSASGR